MQSIGTPTSWITFAVIVVGALAIRLRLSRKQTMAMTRRQAAAWTSVWVSLAAAFGGGILLFANDAHNEVKAMEFFTAYLIEYSLSVDNLLVFLLLFSSFKVPQEYRHRVLFWGILGAVVLRAIFVFAGIALLHRFHFIIYLFGAFLILTGLRQIIGSEDDQGADVSDNGVVKFARRFFRVSEEYDGEKFFSIRGTRRVATPLLLVLVCIEFFDAVFAIDSIPAIFGVSLDPFIVYTSNIFAVLGLRALFSLLSGALVGIRFLNPALGLVLAFVGVKMCLDLIHNALARLELQATWLPQEIPASISLGVVGGVLALGIIVSMLFPGETRSVD